MLNEISQNLRGTLNIKNTITLTQECVIIQLDPNMYHFRIKFIPIAYETVCTHCLFGFIKLAWYWLNKKKTHVFIYRMLWPILFIWWLSTWWKKPCRHVSSLYSSRFAWEANTTWLEGQDLLAKVILWYLSSNVESWRKVDGSTFVERDYGMDK